MTTALPRDPPREAGVAPARGQRRNLTILFADIHSSTKLSRAMEYEEYSELVRGLQAVFAEVIRHHGGELVRIVGDGVIAAFGYPEAHEDDGRRATETALDLHEAARRFGAAQGGEPRIRLHSGIHSGLVLFEEGDLVRGRFEPFGAPINIAAHLSEIAAEDEIVVSASTLESERYFFRTSEARQVGLDDGSEPVEILTILGRDTTTNRFAARMRRGLAPFVGRLEELERLRGCLGECAAGVARLCVVVGSAGIGKTRLANEFLNEADARGVQVHRGYCEAYLGARPLQPFLQLLRSVFRIEAATSGERAGELVIEGAERLNPGLAERLGFVRHLLSRQAAQGDGAVRIAPAAAEAIATLREIFERVAETGPVVLFIDDWQWADDMSRQALDAVRSIQGRPILMLLATREYGSLEAEMNDASVVELPPLTAPESQRSIANLLRSPPAPFLIERVSDYAGGNPLFIEELCQSEAQWADGQKIENRSAWLDAMIESRFARLGEDPSRLVRAASVVGHIVPAWLFEEITGCGPDHPLMTALSGNDFIYPGEVPGTLRFKHGLTRDAIYRTVGLRERRALHMRVVAALKHRAVTAGESENCEALAYHCGAGGDRASAARYAELAGDQAMAVSSLDRAQEQYRAALAALEALEQSDGIVERWNAVIRKYGLAAVVDPSREHVPIIKRATAAAAERRDLGALAWSEFWLGYIYYGLGEARESIDHCRRALAAAETLGDDKLIVQVRATLGQAHGIACQYDPALTLMDEAIEIKRRHRSGARASIGLAYSLSAKAFVLADLGRFDECHAHFDEALSTLGGAPHEMTASVLTQHSGACLWQGRMDEAIRHAKEGERVARRVKARYLFSMAHALAGYAHWRRDGSPEALKSLIEATSWLEASDSRQFLSLNFGWCAEAMVAEGRLAEARRYAAHAFRRARRGDRLGEAMAYRALARSAARDGSPRRAQHYLARAVAAGESRGAAHERPKGLVCAAEFAAMAGDRAGAVSLLARAAPDLASMAMDWFQAQAATASA